MAKEQKAGTNPLSQAEENLRRAQQNYEKVVHSNKAKPEAKVQALAEKRSAAMALQAARRNRPVKMAKTVKTTEK